MRLVKVTLRNFRCYKEDFSIHIGDLTTLIGKNESGKSTILDALQIFFDDVAPDPDDATTQGDKSDVRIICEFDTLPKTLVIDADYPTDLPSEYLLNDEGRLEIHKVYDCRLKKPKLSGTFAQCIHPTVEGMNDLLLLKNADLKRRAGELNVPTEGIDVRVNTQLRRAIWETAADLRLRSRPIPLDAETAKRIWDMLRNELPVYALFKSDRPSTDQDAEAQDPMKAAIKEAIKEKESDLEQIAEFIREQVEEIATRTVEKLREMDPRLASQLKPRFTPPPWANIFKVSLTGDEEIPINKRGSGVRRLILLSFFRAKAEQKVRHKSATQVIYGIEEPETSQHPDNQRMLVHAFNELASQGDCQVILSTHVPALARLLPLESLCYIEVCGDGTRFVHSGDDETYEIIANALGVLPDHNVRLFIGLEGPNDINFLKNMSDMLRSGGEDPPDLQQLEDDGRIIFVPLGGGNLALWASRLKELNIPEFYIFDRGVQPTERSPHQGTVDDINTRPRCNAYLTSKAEMENYLHRDAIRKAGGVAITFDDFDDVAQLAAQAVHEASESEKSWEALDSERKKKKESRAKLWLNTEAVHIMTSQMLDERDPAGDVRGWFNKIAELLDS